MLREVGKWADSCTLISSAEYIVNRIMWKLVVISYGVLSQSVEKTNEFSSGIFFLLVINIGGTSA